MPATVCFPNHQPIGRQVYQLTEQQSETSEPLHPNRSRSHTVIPQGLFNRHQPRAGVSPQSSDRLRSITIGSRSVSFSPSSKLPTRGTAPFPHTPSGTSSQLRHYSSKAPTTQSFVPGLVRHSRARTLHRSQTAPSESCLEELMARVEVYDMAANKAKQLLGDIEAVHYPADAVAGKPVLAYREEPGDEAEKDGNGWDFKCIGPNYDPAAPREYIGMPRP
jgi:hypothetical protein